MILGWCFFLQYFIRNQGLNYKKRNKVNYFSSLREEVRLSFSFLCLFNFVEVTN